jgi:hypothetical protein
MHALTEIMPPTGITHPTKIMAHYGPHGMHSAVSPPMAIPAARPLKDQNKKCMQMHIYIYISIAAKCM